MTPSATLCRAQQAYHHDRAEQTALENVRVISIKAAVAWGKEATRAEQREANGEKRRVGAAVATMAIVGDAPWSDARLSENPDRGFASP